MDKLFLAIRDKLKSDVPEVKYFDWDNGQLDGENKTPPSLPAVLMDIQDVDYEQVAQGGYLGEMIISIKCGFRVRGRSDSNAPNDQDLTALEFITILKSIGAALVNLSSENTKGLNLDRMVRITTDELKVYQYQFSCEYYRTDNLKEFDTEAKPPLDINT